MGTQILRTQPGNFDFRPNIIPPTQGDLEEARIKRLVDLAKLKELTLAPGFEQQRLDLTRNAQTNEQQYRTGVLNESVSHNVAEEKHWADLLGLDQDKLKETAREHDTALSELGDYHKGVLRNQLTDSFMAHLAPLYANQPELVQNVLKNRGLPELSAAAQMLGEKQNQTLADTTLSQINLAKSKGLDTTPLLENLKVTNKPAYDLIKDKLPTETLPTTSASTAHKLGTFAKYAGPAGLGYLLYEGGKGVAKKVNPKSIGDFIRGLTGEQ
jgi:hypothetical protein